MVKCYLHKEKKIFVAKYFGKFSIADIQDVYRIFYKLVPTYKKITSIAIIGKNTNVWEKEALKFSSEETKKADPYTEMLYITEVRGIHRIFYRIYLSFLAKEDKKKIRYFPHLESVEQALHISFPNEFIELQ